MAWSIAALLLCLSGSLAAPQDQKPLRTPILLTDDHTLTSGHKSSSNTRKLQGRFLHISDIHPDPFYKSHSDPEDACHHGKGAAGFYGAEDTDCDSPIALVNATFQWIEDNLKDKIDFVIWTGDSARHDNDERRPRTEKQVAQLNEFIVEKFVEVLGKPDNIGDGDPTNDFLVPIVPTFGNNDILPHNIFKIGPNRWTRRYLKIWDKFIPEAQRHSFERGGWFFTEVIPNKLAVFSLNTLFFFDSNAAVAGCNSKSEPGYEHMEWLRIQLQLLRKRGMKAIITGHVPPARTASKQSWDESCWQKYTLWMKQYRDVVVGGAYGHMNIDHFMLQDSEELEQYYIDGKSQESDSELLTMEQEPTFKTQAGSNYLLSLREEWSSLPKLPSTASWQNGDDVSAEKKRTESKVKKEKDLLDAIGGEWAERFSLSLVSPSVVPNYYPTLRIVEYNISGIEDSPVGPGASEPENHKHRTETAKKKKNKKKKNKHPKFKVPKGPSKSSPPGPAYSPQTLSWLSYTQYFANLTYSNKEIDDTKNKPRNLTYEVEYDTKNDKVYALNDLTVKSYLDLALRIGKQGKSNRLQADDAEDIEDTPGNQESSFEDQRVEFGSGDVKEIESSNDLDASKHKKKKKKHKHRKGQKINKIWAAFVRRAFVGTMTEDEIEDAF
ncbi:MAG: hypothetical protein Q9227_007439 [Pyrenula ochraceoflavens]